MRTAGTTHLAAYLSSRIEFSEGTPVNSVFKIATKLREIEIAQGDLLTRQTVAEVGKQIIAQFNQVMNEYLDNETRNLIVDEWQRRVGGAILEYRPDDDSSN